MEEPLSNDKLSADYLNIPQKIKKQTELFNKLKKNEEYFYK